MAKKTITTDTQPQLPKLRPFSNKERDYFASRISELAREKKEEFHTVFPAPPDDYADIDKHKMILTGRAQILPYNELPVDYRGSRETVQLFECFTYPGRGEIKEKWLKWDRRHTNFDAKVDGLAARTRDALHFEHSGRPASRGNGKAAAPDKTFRELYHELETYKVE